MDCSALFEVSRKLRISIVTAVRNGAATIADTIQSVARQDYGDVEHVVVDCLSTDGTCEIVRGALRRGGRLVSERDAGIYDAFNKGLAISSGEVIAFLNSDDYYVDSQVLATVAARFHETGVDAVFADAGFIDEPIRDRFVRRYRSSIFARALVPFGIMPAHSTLFLRRRLFEKFGIFDPTYKIAGDFELIARFFYLHRASFAYVPSVLTVMRIGGVSTRGMASSRIISREILRACRSNRIYSNWFMVRARYIWKIRELLG